MLGSELTVFLIKDSLGLMEERVNSVLKSVFSRWNYSGMSNFCFNDLFQPIKQLFAKFLTLILGCKFGPGCGGPRNQKFLIFSSKNPGLCKGVSSAILQAQYEPGQSLQVRLFLVKSCWGVSETIKLVPYKF